MNKINIYLSGACKHTSYNFQSWRRSFKNYLEDYVFNDLFNVIDPMIHFDYDDNKPPTDKACHDLFFHLIDKSDVLIVNLDNSDLSPGTAMEVHHALVNNIPIIGFGNMKDTWYPWVKEECSVVLSSIHNAIEYVYEHYCI